MYKEKFILLEHDWHNTFNSLGTFDSFIEAKVAYHKLAKGDGEMGGDFAHLIVKCIDSSGDFEMILEAQDDDNDDQPPIRFDFGRIEAAAGGVAVANDVGVVVPDPNLPRRLDDFWR